MAFAWRCRRCKGPHAWRCRRCKTRSPYPLGEGDACRKCGARVADRVEAPLPGGPDDKPWAGACPSCGGHYDGERVSVYDDEVPGAEIQPIREGDPISMSDAVAGQLSDPSARFTPTGSPGLDWVLGGGVPPDIAILLSSPAGAGKSTLLVETFRKLAKRHDCLYICSEESTTQMGRRYAYLGAFPPRLMVLHETDFDKITEAIEERRPKFVAVDSLHDIEGVNDSNSFTYSTGSNTSVTLATKALKKLAGEVGCTVFLVAHVTKDGMIAGSNTVRHAVDCKLYLNGRQKLVDGDYNIVGVERTVRCDGKYRFGETGRQAYFRFDSSGLHDMGPWHREMPPWEIQAGSRDVERSSDG